MMTTMKTTTTTFPPFRPRSPERSHQDEDGLRFDEFRLTSDSESVHCPPSTYNCGLRGSSCHAGTVSHTNHLSLRQHQDEDGLRFDDFRLTSDSESVHCPPSTHNCRLRGSSCHAGTVSHTNRLSLRPHQDRDDDVRLDEIRLTSGSDSFHSPPSIHSRGLNGSSCHAGAVSHANHRSLRPHQDSDSFHSPP
jgi:hypothetical protein